MSGRQLLLVAGSGRSGTSVFASIVGNLKFHVPEPRVQTDSSNPRGFGEPQWVVDRHDDLLRVVNVHPSDARPSAWSDTARICLNERAVESVRRWLEKQFQQSPRLVVKDPRLLWFLPMWFRVGRDLDAEVSVVTMLRHPAEVVGSKVRWYSKLQIEDSNRIAGWINTMLFTERATRDSRRSFVKFDDIMEDWTQVIARVSDELDLPDLVNSKAGLQAAADSVVDREHARSRTVWDDLNVSEGLADFAERIWGDLLLLADPSLEDEEEIQSRLDSYRREYASFYRHAEAVAQSTTLAVKRELKPRTKPQTAPKTPEAKSGKVEEQTAPLPKAIREIVPGSVRKLIPLRIKLLLDRYLR